MGYFCCSWGKGAIVKKRLVLTAVSLAMLLTLTTAVALAQTDAGASDEFRCLCSPRDATCTATVRQT